MGNSTAAPKQQSTRTTSSKSNKSESDINGVRVDKLNDEELDALKQVCLSYIDQIEFVIDSIPEKKENETEPDFEPIFLQLKTFVSSAKLQLGRQELNYQKEERTLKLNTQQVSALPDLPTEEPPTPSISINPWSPSLTAADTSLTYEAINSSLTSIFSENTLDKQSLFKKFTTRNVLLDDDTSIISKTERDRIKSEIKHMKKQLKTRKFELLSSNIWNDYLLQYLCRNEQFILSSTCRFCRGKCSLSLFVFCDEFSFDNIYWRKNFGNFVDPSQDCTLLLNENKFELMSTTQRHQLKYYIKFWDKFLTERKQRKEEYHLKNEYKSSDNDVIDKKIDIDEYKENDDDDDKEEDKEEINDEEEDEDVLDLYASDHDNFEFDDNRPRGQVLLEKYRSDYEFVDELKEDALLDIAIPCDVEQIIIRDSKNKNGELSQWLSSVLCYIASECRIDWFGLENNNFVDRDIHRICAGLLNRNTQSNLVGLSLSNNVYITDKCIAVLLETIAKKCHKLQFLSLSGCTKLSNKTCQYILSFFQKTYSDYDIQLNYIDLSNNYKINDKGIQTLNQIYLQFAPFNVSVRLYVPGTQWTQPMDDWSKNIILKPPKRR